MKKTILIFLVLMQGMMLGAMSQNSKPIVADNVKILNPAKGYLNSINTRAPRDFVARYENASDVLWYKADKGFIARFTRDSVSNGRAAYRSNGLWVYTIVQYQEAAMPKEVRKLVKSTYYDYNITLVEEVEQPNETVKYIVHLQDAVSWKNVLVSNGQMQLIEDKKKL